MYGRTYYVQYMYIYSAEFCSIKQRIKNWKLTLAIQIKEETKGVKEALIGIQKGSSNPNKLPALLEGNYDRPTIQPTDRPTTDG